MKKITKILSIPFTLSVVAVPFLSVKENIHYQVSTVKVFNDTDTATSPEETAKPLPRRLGEKEKAEWKAYLNNLIKTKLDEFLNVLQNFLLNRSQQLDELEEYTDIEKIVEKAYLSKVVEYISKNKNDIQNSIGKYELPFVFPRIFYEDYETSIGTVKWNDTDYVPITWGKSPSTDYAKETANAPKEENTTSHRSMDVYDKFQVYVQNYINNFGKRLHDIFLNKEDFPEYKKHFILNSVYQNGVGYLDMSDPIGIEGVNSWDDYINQKIHKQTLKFDLEENQRYTQENILTPPVDNPEVLEEDILTDSKGDKVPITNSYEIRDIPNLVAYVSPVYSNLSSQRIRDIFNSVDDVEKQKLFFFQNPMSIRYEYSVQSANETNGKLNLSVKLEDKLVKTNSRVYSVEVTNINENEQENFRTRLRFNITESLKSIIEDIKTSLMLNDLLQIKKSYSAKNDEENPDANRAQQRHINNIIFALTKFMFYPDLIEEQTKLLEQGVKSYSGGPGTEIISDANYEIKKYFLNQLKHSYINSTKISSVIAQVTAMKFHENITNFNKEKDTILKTFQENNLNINQLVNVINYLTKVSDDLKLLGETDSIDNVNNFYQMVDLSQDLNLKNESLTKVKDFFNKTEGSEAALSQEFSQVSQQIEKSKILQSVLISLSSLILIITVASISIWKALLIKKRRKQ
ncbi:hypothetical protein NV226_02940 [Mycoplasma iguanae]|uniref:Uncharacterized protein n=1 Tax=Mycoplasma iguanae TaxID=292461 RepID=A0ABY5RBS0_9MOLU|nr:hypothetical protein [Mycoplasma iguanae]UVD81655.1 hypothetical protein NV226_02940 [Mycoplasma iguanae]